MARDLAECTDEDLLIQCRTGDAGLIRGAIGVIARRHHRGLINFLYRFVGDTETSEDLAQEALIRLLRHAREYREVARVSTWLYTIAGNLARNELRRRRSRPALSLSFELESTGRSFEASLASDDPGPSERVEKEEIQARVQAAISSIPDLFQAIIILVDIQGRTYKEAADLLDIEVGTVRSRLFRARAKLLEVLSRSENHGLIEDGDA